jgi:hypothetical protein
MASKANLKSSGREAALARRRAMSEKGKQGVRTSTAERTRVARAKPDASAPQQGASAAQRAASASAAAPIGAPVPQLSAVSTAPRRAAGKSTTSPSQASRALARQRRNSMAQAGRKALRATDRVRTADGAKETAGSTNPGQPKSDCGCGCNGARKQETSRAQTPQLQPPVAAGSAPGNGKRAPRNKRAEAALGAKPTGRALSLARRAALSNRGKGATNAPSSAAGLARQANPKLSGRELAQKVRAQRSVNGGAGERKSKPSGRMRPQAELRGAADQPWKVGVTETAMGQSVTGTKVGRSRKTTGDEPSTCRTITGTEYMGADIFREFCQTDPPQGSQKVSVSPTGHGNRVTGNEVGRSSKVTGDEPGTCKSVTGTEYLSPRQQESFCGFQPEPGPRKVGSAQTRAGQAVSGTQVGRSVKVTGDEHGAGVRPTGTQYTDVESIQNGRVDTTSGASRGPVPAKVGQSVTLAGRTVTGTRVGRSGKVTGDEPGSCRIVTGDEYADRGQYDAFCGLQPQPEPPKVGESTTLKKQVVSGTQTGRSAKVTGDEPGTCKAITGTPYAGLEQAAEYCPTEDQRGIQARSRQLASTPGPRMTGIQPGIGGVMTGAAKGACEPLTGTPYVGRDQYAATCGGSGAQPGEADFPRTLDADGAPWEHFSVMSPARQAFQASKSRSGVTGTRYETGGHITGPFDMGVGKITGTEQFRFDAKNLPQPSLMTMAPGEANEEAAADEPARPRITGEGQSAGSKITGDDWERGDRVTGTEGASAKRRNPTRPGPMSAMPAPDRKRNEEVPAPVSRVTGSSGSTERGALVTYSGGARG